MKGIQIFFEDVADPFRRTILLALRLPKGYKTLFMYLYEISSPGIYIFDYSWIYGPIV